MAQNLNPGDTEVAMLSMILLALIALVLAGLYLYLDRPRRERLRAARRLDLWAQRLPASPSFRDGEAR